MIAFLLCCATLGPPGIPAGSAKLELNVLGTKLEVFTYKPASYAGGPLILVFHGASRNARTYRDNTRALADRFGAIVAAPLFDARHFPGPRYSYGDLRAVTEGRPTSFALVPKLADELRRLEGRRELPYYLIGHSAGGQFLARLLAVVPAIDALGVIAANPISQPVPSRELRFPAGFGGLPEALSTDDALKRYLAQPLTVYVGLGDSTQQRYLAPTAARPNPFDAAERLAKARGWPFKWRMVRVPGVGHDHHAMFVHPLMGVALGLPTAPR